MGEVRVPADAKWGAQTQRAVENFPISGLPIERRLIRALALVKGEAARVNARLKEVPSVTKAIGDAIAASADEVADGRWDAQFPIDVFQTGSGTSSNMNANEVHRRARDRAARVAGAPQRPRQRVAVVERRVPVGDPPRRRPRRSSRDLDPRDRASRPVAAAQAARVQDGREVGPHPPDGRDAGDARPGVRRLRRAGRGRDRAARRTRCRASASCRSAAPPSAPGSTRRRRFARAVIARLATRTGLPLTEARDHFAAQGARDALVEALGRAAHARGRRWSRSPTTSAGWAAARAPGWPRSASPICSPARRSCPAR